MILAWGVGWGGVCWGGGATADVLDGGLPAGLSPVAAFMPPPGSRPPASDIEGRLTLSPEARPNRIRVLTGEALKPGDARLTWPPLSLEVALDGDRLIPAVRGPIAGDNPEWEWLVSPGLAWTEAGDGGAVDAVLPVALEERNANCVHTGRLRVRLGRDGVEGRAAVQFDGETCAYFRFDATSLVPATFTPGPVAGARALIARDRAERAARAPLKTLADLAAAYPGLDIAALARAAGPNAIWGLDDGVSHYAAPCRARAGVDPLCAERALPSYSTAKTLVGAQALFRLEALRPGSVNEKVADHVAACAARGGWGDVRLIDLLDMASGHYVSAGPEADEDSAATLAFFMATTAADKLAFACGEPRASDPGKLWVYHTADSFLLGVAMADVSRTAGQGGDVYDDLVLPIWRAIGQSADLDTTRRTYDAAARPFTGWGLTYTRDDVVRAARFLARGGTAAGKAWLDRRLLAEALQQADPGGGFQALGLPNLRYRHGVWARDVGPLIACPHPVWTPFLSGYGGVSIVLFPNDVRFYAFNDDGHFDWGESVAQVNRIRPLCGQASSAPNMAGGA